MKKLTVTDRIRLLQKSLALLLALIFLVGVLPVAAFTAAAQGNGGTAVKMGTVNTDNLEVRAEASYDAEVLEHLAINTRIEILEQKTVDGVKWGRIEEGWIILDDVIIDVVEPDAQSDEDPTEDPNKNAKQEPPATEPPATEPPATEPPATEPPATEPPATEPPATEPPATEPPATEPSATEPPATEPPATEPPATEPPATEPEEAPEEDSNGIWDKRPSEETSVASPTKRGKFLVDSRKTANNDGLTYGKSVTSKGDGTYQLNLTVKSSESMKLDLLIVVDRSRSMIRDPNDGTTRDRLKNAKDAAKAMIDVIEANAAVDAEYRIMEFSGSGHPKYHDDAIGKLQDSEGRFFKVVNYSEAWSSDVTKTENFIDKIHAFDTRIIDDWGNEYLYTNRIEIQGDLVRSYSLNATNYEAVFQTINEKKLMTNREDATKVIVFLTDGDPTATWTKIDNELEWGTTYDDKKNVDACLEKVMDDMRKLTADRLYLVGFGEATLDNLKKLANEATGVGLRKAIGSSSDELSNTLMSIGADIFFTKVTIADTLSHRDGNANKPLLVNVTDPSTVKVTVETGSETYNGSSVSLPKTGINEATTLTPVYDSTKGTLTLTFPEEYRLEKDYEYSISATIAPTAAAYQLYRDNNEEYQNWGEEKTGTHQGEKGIYSNDRATVTYNYKGSEGIIAEYAQPVVQLNPGTLKVSKTFSGLPSGQALPQNFALNVTINYPSDGDSSTPDTVTKELTLADLKQSDGYYYTFTGLTPGTTYTITESGYTLDGYKTTISTKVNGAASGTTATVSGTVAKDENETVAFTNTYEVSVTNVTVKKLVSGNMGSWDDSFAFTATISTGSMKGIEYSINGGATTTISTDSFTFNLKHNDTIVFSGVPLKETLTVKENNSGNYVLTAQIDGGKATYPEGDSVAVVATALNGHTIALTNRWDVEIETGIILDSLPYVLILIGVVAAGAFLFLRKPRRYED